MRIDVLCYDLSNNALGRAYLLADLLRRSGHRVRIAGLRLGPSVWGPLADCDIETLQVPSGARYPDSLSGLGRLVAALDCDVAVASKPRAGSFGAALLKRLRHGGSPRILLDIDDWESGLERPLSAGKLLRRLPGAAYIDSMYDPLVMERLARLADGTTVSTTFLKGMFGGRLLPHVRDTDLLDPSRYDREKLRAGLGLSDEFVIAFPGSVRRHKGAELLLSVLPRLGGIKARLMLMGAAAVDPGTRAMIRRAGGRVIERPDVRLRDLPAFHAVSDLVVLPQQDTPFSRAQLPMKLLDAMAMARPVISTRVSDIPHVLGGCGVLLDGFGGDELVARITELHSDPDLRRRLGESARHRVLERYSYRQGIETLAAALKAL